MAWAKESNTRCIVSTVSIVFILLGMRLTVVDCTTFDGIVEFACSVVHERVGLAG